MIADTALEKEKIEKISLREQHQTLFHLTDYVGLTMSIFNNSIQAKSQNFISTTYDPKNNAIVGRNFAHFKFVLNGTKLLKSYEGFKNEHYLIEVGFNGERNRVRLEEKEIGLKTNQIHNLQYFSDTIVILIDFFTRSFVQWILYQNYNEFGKGIDALIQWHSQGNKILRHHKDGINRNLTKKEYEFLSYCKMISEENLNYPDALSRISKKFEIADHHDNIIDYNQIDREKIASQIIQSINDTIADIPKKELNPKHVEKTIKDGIKLLDFGQNYTDEIYFQIEKRDLFSAYVEPVRWNGLFRHLIKNDPLDEIVSYLNFIENEMKRRNKAFWDSDFYHKGSHTKSNICGIGDGY